MLECFIPIPQFLILTDWHKTGLCNALMNLENLWLQPWSNCILKFLFEKVNPDSISIHYFKYQETGIDSKLDSIKFKKWHLLLKRTKFRLLMRKKICYIVNPFNCCLQRNYINVCKNEMNLIQNSYWEEKCFNV